MKPTYQNGPVTLYCGDCRKVREAIDVTGIDCLVTDPPYGVQLKESREKSGVSTKRMASKFYTDGPEWVIQEIIPRCQEWIEAIGRACLTPGTRMLQHYPYAADMGGIFVPNGAGLSRWGFQCYHPILFYGKCPHRAKYQSSYPTSVRSGPTWIPERGVDHPCPKPVRFMRWMVERSSLPGETVADCFMGSGTTAIACIQTGRKFIGVELDKHFFQIAVKRIEKALREPVIFKRPGKINAPSLGMTSGG